MRLPSVHSHAAHAQLSRSSATGNCSMLVLRGPGEAWLRKPNGGPTGPYWQTCKCAMFLRDHFMISHEENCASSVHCHGTWLQSAAKPQPWQKCSHLAAALLQQQGSRQRRALVRTRALRSPTSGKISMCRQKRCQPCISAVGEKLDIVHMVMMSAHQLMSADNSYSGSRSRRPIQNICTPLPRPHTSPQAACRSPCRLVT